MYSEEKTMKITKEFVSHRRTQYIINTQSSKSTHGFSMLSKIQMT